MSKREDCNMYQPSPRGGYCRRTLLDCEIKDASDGATRCDKCGSYQKKETD